MRVLDVATGTGRTLQQLRGALSAPRLVGLDLCAAYLRQASRWLGRQPSSLPQLLQGNAEALPFADGSMQAVTCIVLLHELPAEARQSVLNECHRVLEAGGVLVLADSVQLADSPRFEPLMDNFRRPFHEPYDRSSISDDIEVRLAAAGFTSIEAESPLSRRVWRGTKAR